MSKAIRWRKIGGGTFRSGTTVVKSGEIFVAALEEIPPAFRRSFVALDEIPAEKEEAPLTPEFIVAPSERKGAGWFDVVDLGSNKIVNEVPLRKKKAEALVGELA